MRHAIPMLLLLVAAAPAQPGPDRSRIITDDELKPHELEYRKLLEEWQAGRLKPGDVVQRYAQRKLERGISRREKAIRTFYFARASVDIGNDFKTARQAYEEAVKTWPDFPQAYIALAGIALRAEDMVQAKRYLRKALAVDDEFVDALVGLGRLALRDKDIDAGERYFTQAMEIEMTPQVCIGLQDVYLRRWREAITDDQRDKWSIKALGAAKAHRELEPKSGLAHLLLAKCYKDLGKADKAIASLEESYAKYELDEQWRLEILSRLVEFYERRADVENVRRTIERLLTLDSINAAQRARLEQMLVDIKEKGKAAPALWVIDSMLAVLRNDLLPVDARVQALDQLLEILERPEVLQMAELRAKGLEIFMAVFRVLVDAPPDVAATTLRWIRQHMQDPALTRILVHFIYPSDDERRSPEVRVAAVRALDSACGTAALPALFFSLSDANGRVVREVDKALARQCERRSLVGGGIAPLTEEEIHVSRKEWNEYLHSDECAGRLAKAYVQLTSLVTGEESRGQRSAPMVDHAIKVVLLDNDVKWPAWKAAYEFLLKYLGKDFRPPEARNQPLEPADRAAIVKEIEDFWRGFKAEEAKVVAPGGGAPRKEQPAKETGKPAKAPEEKK